MAHLSPVNVTWKDGKFLIYAAKLYKGNRYYLYTEVFATLEAARKHFKDEVAEWKTNREGLLKETNRWGKDFTWLDIEECNVQS